MKGEYASRIERPAPFHLADRKYAHYPLRSHTVVKTRSLDMTDLNAQPMRSTRESSEDGTRPSTLGRCFSPSGIIEILFFSDFLLPSVHIHKYAFSRISILFFRKFARIDFARMQEIEQTGGELNNNQWVWHLLRQTVGRRHAQYFAAAVFL